VTVNNNKAGASGIQTAEATTGPGPVQRQPCWLPCCIKGHQLRNDAQRGCPLPLDLQDALCPCRMHYALAGCTMPLQDALCPCRMHYALAGCTMPLQDALCPALLGSCTAVGNHLQAAAAEAPLSRALMMLLRARVVAS
jgi:hypothetical protein